MWRRLLLLLLVACLSGTVVGFVSAARADKEAAPRVPTLPRSAKRSPACPIPKTYRAAFVRASDASGLPLAMLVAVAQVESRFEATAVSAAGARGLLQVLPTTARSLALSAYRPASNVLAGARYLRNLLDRFQSTDLALAAYNAGPTAVARVGGAPTSETLSYVANVTQIWRSLNGCS
jgi:soluble lytic murein transglycosylase-like protein